MKWIGIARIYDKETEHFVCKRRIYVETEHLPGIYKGATKPLYILRFNTEEGYNYKRVDKKFNLEFTMICNSIK